MKFKIAILGLLFTFSSISFSIGQNESPGYTDETETDGSDGESGDNGDDKGGIFEKVIVTRTGNINQSSNEAENRSFDDFDCLPLEFGYSLFVGINQDNIPFNAGTNCSYRVSCIVETPLIFIRRYKLLTIRDYNEGTGVIIDENFDFADCIDGSMEYSITLDIVRVCGSNDDLQMAEESTISYQFDIKVCCDDGLEGEDDSSNFSMSRNTQDKDMYMSKYTEIGSTKNCTLTIYDQFNNVIQSKIVDQHTLENFNINNLDLRQGIYIYTLTSNQGIESKQVFKN